MFLKQKAYGDLPASVEAGLRRAVGLVPQTKIVVYQSLPSKIRKKLAEL